MTAFAQGYVVILLVLCVLGLSALIAADRGRMVLAAVLTVLAAVVPCGGLGYVWLVGEVAS